VTGNTRNGRGQTRRATGSSQSGSQRRPQVPGASPGPAFWPFQPTTTGVVVCETCAAILPATDRAKAIHQRWHQQAGRS